MNDIRVGTWVRVARQRLGLRQEDLAAVGGVSRSLVSRFERGELDGLTLQSCRAICAAAGIELHLVPQSRRIANLERQIDKRHAALVEATVGHLRRAGWTTVTEYSYNYFGERGAADVVAWEPNRRALLIVQVKSELRDTQEMLRGLDRERRILPRLIREDRDWQPLVLGVVLVLPDLTTERGIVARHSATFDAALPSRTVAVKKWVLDSSSDLRAVWFLRVSREEILTQRFSGRQRVRLLRERGAIPISPDEAPESRPGEAARAASPRPPCPPSGAEPCSLPAGRP